MFRQELDDLSVGPAFVRRGFHPDSEFPPAGLFDAGPGGAGLNFDAQVNFQRAFFRMVLYFSMIFLSWSLVTT